LVNLCHVCNFRFVLILAVIGLGAEAKFPRLEEQVCGSRRSELRDAFEAALWQKTGYPEHVNMINLNTFLKYY
jgi:hypothetical protein